jgi:alpha-N-arabinofuranosidase
VLEEAYDLVDYISLHAYYEEHDGDGGSFLASAVDMDHFIESVVATADHVRARLGRTKRINLSFDEWNVWYQRRFQQEGLPADWPVAPRLLEDCYTVTDAVVVGNLLISLLRHSDRVRVACQAQLVNVIAPIMTEPDGPAWRQTIFHPFALTARHARGDVLRVAVDGPTHDTQRFGVVSTVDAAATHDPDTGASAVFVTNRSLDDSVDLDVDIRSLGSLVTVIDCRQLADSDRHARNTAVQPDRIQPRPVTAVRQDGGRVQLRLPPVSWTMLRVGPTAR